MGTEKTTILEMPQGERGMRMKLLLTRYKRRWENIAADSPYKSPEMITGGMEAWYAAFILSELVERGRVDSVALVDEMKIVTHGVFYPEFFISRFGVIQEYILTGEAGGKELPRLKEEA